MPSWPIPRYRQEALSSRVKGELQCSVLYEHYSHPPWQTLHQACSRGQYSLPSILHHNRCTVLTNAAHFSTFYIAACPPIRYTDPKSNRRDYDRRTGPSSSSTTSPTGFRRHTSTHLRTKAADKAADAVHARSAAYDRLRRDREHPTGPSAYWPGRTSAPSGRGHGSLHEHRPPHRNANPSHSHPSATSSFTSESPSMAEASSSPAGPGKVKPEEVRTFRTGWNPEPHKYGSDREYTVSKERRLLWAIIGFGAIVQGVWLLRLAAKH